MDPLSMGMSAISALLPVVGQGMDLAGKGLDFLGKLVDAKGGGEDKDKEESKICGDMHQKNTMQVIYNG